MTGPPRSPAVRLACLVLATLLLSRASAQDEAVARDSNGNGNQNSNQNSNSNVNANTNSNGNSNGNANGNSNGNGNHACRSADPVLIDGDLVPACCVVYAKDGVGPVSAPPGCVARRAERSMATRATLNTGKITTYQDTNDFGNNASATFGFASPFAPLLNGGPNLETAFKIVLSSAEVLGARFFWRSTESSVYAELYSCTDGTDRLCVVGDSLSLGSNPAAMSGPFSIGRSLGGFGNVYTMAWTINGQALQYVYRTAASTMPTSIKLHGAVGAPGLDDCANWGWRGRAYATNIAADGLARPASGFSRVEHQTHPSTGSCAADDGQVYYRV